MAPGGGGDQLGLAADELAGAQAVRRALLAPALHILRNAGLDALPIAARIASGPRNTGFDVLGEQMGDMFAAGIVDATSIVCGALEASASVAGLLLTVEALVTDRH